MRISVVDPSGAGLGLAIGLVELGHDVRYTPAEPWPDEPAGGVDGMTAELIERFFGGPTATPEPDAELLVSCDGFGDALHALETRCQLGARFDPERPLRRSISPLAYPARLGLHLDLACAAERVVVIDASDSSRLRESAFEHVSKVTLLAREVPLHDRTGLWRPWPFLYHPIFLWLDYCQPRADWCTPRERRRSAFDWVFCGTVDHPRYGGRRRALLDEVATRWPTARRHELTGGAPFVDALRLLASTDAMLDLPGSGVICFRLHEALALDVPILRPWPFEVVVPAAVHDACVPSPRSAKDLAPGVVRALYDTGYAPRHAALAMLEAIAEHDAARNRAPRDDVATGGDRHDRKALAVDTAPSTSQPA